MSKGLSNMIHSAKNQQRIKICAAEDCDPNGKLSHDACSSVFDIFTN